MAPFPEPYLTPDLVTRMLDGEPDRNDCEVALTALMRVCDTLAEVLRDGVSDRDWPTLIQAQATSTVIDSEFLARSVQEHSARKQQTRIPFVYGYAGAASPLNG